MRFLLTVQPMFGHFHAMAPLAQALKEHGHEVAFATGKDLDGLCFLQSPKPVEIGFHHQPGIGSPCHG